MGSNIKLDFTAASAEEQARKALESALDGKKNEFEKCNKRLREERRMVVDLMLVDEVSLDGEDDLVGPMVTISGKKCSKQVLPC